MDALVYIRHGHDAKTSHDHDEKLTRLGRRKARQLARQLVKKYGVPSAIFCSPFHRTRQTAIVMQKVVSSSVPVYTDVRLGRHFTKRQRAETAHLLRSTVKSGAIVQETNGDFHERVLDQLYERLINDDQYKVVWNISHSLVLLKVANEMEIKRNKHVDYLDTVVVRQYLSLMDRW